MKVSCWQDVIISWANALRLTDEPVTDVLDLVKGPFFIRLLNKTRKAETDSDGEEAVLTQDKRISCQASSDPYTVIEEFLKDEFSGLRLLGYWDSEEVTLVSSVLLLWSSLGWVDCQTPLYCLDEGTQVKIHTFIQRFLDTPQHLINRQLLTQAILDITFEGGEVEDAGGDESYSENCTTPRRSNLTPLQSPGVLALSEVRSLRSKVDLLNCEKHHLLDEIQLIKAELLKAKQKSEEKEVEVMRLRNRLSEAWEDQRSELLGEAGEAADSPQEGERGLFKEELQEFKEVVSKLREDLEAISQENSLLTRQLEEEKKRGQEWEARCLELEERAVGLQGKLEQLEILSSTLKRTCEEQRCILEERKEGASGGLRVEDESWSGDITAGGSAGETLDGVIDIKYSELQEELKQITERLTEESKLNEELQRDKIKLKEVINSLKQQLDECQVCGDCPVLKRRILSLESLNESKRSECSRYRVELDELRCWLNKKSQESKKLAEIRKEKSQTISDLTNKLDGLKEELLTLQYELFEKNNTIDFCKDEINFLKNCLASKTVELKGLETDMKELVVSKESEICGLRRRVDELRHALGKSKECREIEGDAARQLVRFDESLQWKALKIGDLTLRTEQLKSELNDKERLNRELQERLVYLTGQNREANRELETSKKSIAELQSKLATLEYKQKRLNQEIVKKNLKFEAVDSELKQICDLVWHKFQEIEIDSCVLAAAGSKPQPQLEDIINFVDCISLEWREKKNILNELSLALCQVEAESAQKTAELEMFQTELDQLTSFQGSIAVEKWLDENKLFQERLSKIQTDFDRTRRRCELLTTEAQTKDARIRELAAETERLRAELEEKSQLTKCLQENINLYEHEKNILKKKLYNCSTNKDASNKTDSGTFDGEEVEGGGEEEALEREEVVSRTSLEDSSTVRERLHLLQVQMKAHYEGELRRLTEEYSTKLDQYKSKVKKDCAHIEELSRELWDTSDRLLLAQQECEALRGELRRTKALLPEHRGGGASLKAATEESTSFMWLGLESDDWAGEELLDRGRRRGRRGRRRGKAGEEGEDEEREEELFDEEFNADCLADLKAGICRLPSSQRLSCPAESTRIEDETAGGIEDHFLVPRGKPRKLKGSIMYRKPGPPTPSVSAARHSLPGTELRRGLRELNTGTASAAGVPRSRLSLIFNSISLSTKTKHTTLQEPPTPKTKKKGFFQRTFGNRENLPPRT